MLIIITFLQTFLKQNLDAIELWFVFHMDGVTDGKIYFICYSARFKIDIITNNYFKINFAKNGSITILK